MSWGFKDRKLPGWRLRVNENFSEITGDILVRRSDGIIAYHMASVIDELTLGITEVIRGKDLLEIMPTHLAVADSLHSSNLIYKHVPIMLDKNGQKLSKRDGSIGLSKFKEDGMSSSQLIGWLASTLGLVPYKSELSLQELLVDLKKKEL